MKIKKNLKKIAAVGTALTGILTAPLSVSAQEKDFHKIKNQSAYEYSIPLQENYQKKSLNDSLKEEEEIKKDSKLTFLAKMGAGALGGYGLHEGTHYLAAKASGVDIDFKMNPAVKVKYGEQINSKSKSQQRLIHGSGILAQTLGSEIILNSKESIRKNPYALGFLAFSTANNLVYGLFPDLGGSGSSDIRSLEKTGVNGKLLRGALVAHSAWAAYRALKKPEENKKINFYIVPLPEGGAEAGFEYRF